MRRRDLTQFYIRLRLAGSCAANCRCLRVRKRRSGEVGRPNCYSIEQAASLAGSDHWPLWK
jgi:hypothetical protein